MELGIDINTILIGILIFLARIMDVSIGTFRTICVVQGRIRLSFFLGFLEVSMWLVVISAVLSEIAAKPILGIFYALGFSTGNVCGILLERRLAFGQSVIRIISDRAGSKMASLLREAGHEVIVFAGDSGHGPVEMLYLVCRRKDIKTILDQIKAIDPDAFYTIDLVGNVSKTYPALGRQVGR